jgi:hypothetical protein
MFDHNPKHQSEMLMASQLKPFFNDVEREYQGKTVYLYPDSHLEYTAGNADPVTLDSLTFVRRLRKDVLTIHTTDKGDPHEIEIIANLVWIIRDVDGEVIAFEVIDEQDAKMMVEFKRSQA